jgi:hypothetical protein
MSDQVLMEEPLQFGDGAVVRDFDPAEQVTPQGAGAAGFRVLERWFAAPGRST